MGRWPTCGCRSARRRRRAHRCRVDPDLGVAVTLGVLEVELQVVATGLYAPVVGVGPLAAVLLRRFVPAGAHGGGGAREQADDGDRKSCGDDAVAPGTKHCG